MAETQGERIAALETKIANIESKINTIDKKLDDIIDLKNKGLGAFWLASAILGTGIVTFISHIYEWIKGLS